MIPFHEKVGTRARCYAIAAAICYAIANDNLTELECACLLEQLRPYLERFDTRGELAQLLGE